MIDNVVKSLQKPTPDECLENMKGLLEEVTIIGVTTDGSIVINGNLGPSDAYMLIAMGMSILLSGAMGDDDAIH